jgi:MFS transporter, DHA1 family, multidrug resistance protein
MSNKTKPISKALKCKITILNIIIPFLMGTAIDLYVPSLPVVANYFHVQNYLVQLSIGLYMFGYAMGQMLFGVLADHHGRKKVLLGSIIFFTVVSFIAAWSPNVYVLNVCRFLQGLAVAGLTTYRAITMDCFSGLELTKAMNSISVSWALGPIVGPFIGSYLQHYFSWQANFYFFGCYGLAILFYTAIFIPETHFELVRFNSCNLRRFIISMLTNKLFLCYSAVLVFTYAALVIFNVVAPFLVQVVLKYSVIEYGRIALLLGFGYFFGNTVSRFLVSYFPPLCIAFSGICGAVITSFIMIGLGVFIELNLSIVIIPAFLLFCFCGLIFPNVAGTILNLFNKNAGVVNAIMGTVQVSGVFLLSILATLLKTDSQMPLALFYAASMLLNLLLILGCKNLNKNVVNI